MTNFNLFFTNYGTVVVSSTVVYHLTRKNDIIQFRKLRQNMSAIFKRYMCYAILTEYLNAELTFNDAKTQLYLNTQSVLRSQPYFHLS
jgi:hypothetical protein